MSESAVKELRRSPGWHLLALSPLLLSGSAACLLIAVAPGAWAVADGFGLASWAPTASALMLALPVLLLSLYAAWRLLPRMRGLFEVDIASAAIGGISHWVAAVCLVIFSGTISSADSYRSLGAESTSTGGFMFLVVLAVLIGVFLHAGLTMVYIWSITPGRKTRIAERGPDEVDFVEHWGRRR